jgi:hypothetical protein
MFIFGLCVAFLFILFVVVLIYGEKLHDLRKENDQLKQIVITLRSETSLEGRKKHKAMSSQLKYGNYIYRQLRDSLDDLEVTRCESVRLGTFDVYRIDVTDRKAKKLIITVRVSALADLPLVIDLDYCGRPGVGFGYYSLTDETVAKVIQDARNGASAYYKEYAKPVSQ